MPTQSDWCINRHVPFWAKPVVLALHHLKGLAKMTAQYFIAKVYRQHSSLVIAVPKAVCIALDLKAGQHMLFTWDQSAGKFRFAKFKPVGEKDARVGTDSSRKH